MHRIRTIFHLATFDFSLGFSQHNESSDNTTVHTLYVLCWDKTENGNGRGMCTGMLWIVVNLFNVSDWDIYSIFT